MPRSQAPQRECDYENLVYACLRCNSWKRDQWPVLDPCLSAFGEHLRIQDDGTIEDLTTEGERLIAILALDYPPLVDFRRRWIAALRVLNERLDEDVTKTLREFLGFPDDLPDLASLRPPGGNSRPEGVETSYFALRELGLLPSTYQSH
jgi:hypothetical protein